MAWTLRSIQYNIQRSNAVIAYFLHKELLFFFCTESMHIPHYSSSIY